MTVKAKNSKNNNGGTGKILLTIAIVILILIILFSIGAIIVNRYLNKIQKIDDVDIVAPEDVVDEVDPIQEEGTENTPAPVVEEVEWNAEELENIDAEELINIMLVGQDTRSSSGRERSDAMILCSINPETREVALISFMRDMYVQMPDGYMDNRMNAAYAFGGFPYLYTVLEKNFGVTCDGGFEVNFDGFRNVIDAVGGVDIELSSGEANIVGGGAVAGYNHLSGEQALQYCRIRKIGSDFQRTERQRTVLRAVFNSVKGADLSTLTSLVDTILPMMRTDMTNADIISLTTKLLPLLSEVNLNTYRIPVDGGYYDASIRGMSVLVPNLDTNRKALEGYLPFEKEE